MIIVDDRVYCAIGTIVGTERKKEKIEKERDRE